MEKEKIYNLIADDGDAGDRLDIFLTRSIEEVSRNFIQKLFEQGNIKLNGELCISKKYKVRVGDELRVTLPEPMVLQVEPEDIPLEIIFEDEDVLVVNKPKGMVVHPGAGNYTGTLVNAIMYHCKDRLSTINGVIRPGIVHRIDKDTSGLIMIAKNDKAHESLSKQLKEHTVNREYTALVYNNFKEDEGTVETFLGRDPKNRFRRAVVSKDATDARQAITHWRVKDRFGAYTLIGAKLETGRTHQIRVHMAYIKHPLVGDLVYGPKKTPIKVEGQMLHAGLLGFEHPTTRKYMEFAVPLPTEFIEVVNKIKGN